MPWKKSFDEELAVGKAMELFWEKGYEAASIADLITHTGVNRGSLYNAFGGKQALFLKALIKYDVEHRRAIIADLEALDEPKRAIRLLFETIVAETLDDSQHKGCFLINTASEIAFHQDDVKKLVKKGLREMEAFFRRCIEIEQTRGNIARERDAHATAKTLLGLVIAIRVLGKGAYERASLEAIASQALDLLQ